MDMLLKKNNLIGTNFKVLTAVTSADEIPPAHWNAVMEQAEQGMPLTQLALIPICHHLLDSKTTSFSFDEVFREDYQACYEDDKSGGHDH